MPFLKGGVSYTSEKGGADDQGGLKTLSELCGLGKISPEQKHINKTFTRVFTL